MGWGRYVGCFGNLPPVDMAKIRADTVAYIEAFDHTEWHKRPVCTIVHGVHLDGSGELTPTPDAFGNDVGRMVPFSQNPPSSLYPSLGHTITPSSLLSLWSLCRHTPHIPP